MVGPVSERSVASAVKRYCITDSFEVAARASSAGAVMVQIRAKDLSARALTDLVRRAVRCCSAPMLVNTRWDISLICDAAGVHLPADSISPALIRQVAPPGFLIGVSCHSAEELRRAQGEGADFAVFGPVFSTPGKGPPIGLEAFREAIAGLKLPVYALGGIDAANAPDCISAGAAGVAGIRMFE